MCKTGVACSYSNEQGRIDNIRLNQSRNNIVGDFKGNDSRDLKLVAISSITPFHGKAKKQLAKIMKPLEAQLRPQPEEKVAV